MANRLQFVMQHTDPLHDLWCWAAVAASVAEFKEHTPHLQCTVASAVLVGEPCCGGGDCNRPARLEDALSSVGHFLFDQHASTTHARIRDEVDAGNPVCVRVGWDDQLVGHFLAIIGYHDDGDSVVTVDPKYGLSPMISLQTLKSSYQGLGQWTDTYFVD